jgi:hypothetical protein
MHSLIPEPAAFCPLSFEGPNCYAQAGLRHLCVLFWNANDTMSFNRVNWPRLNQVSRITTVSRNMKHLTWDMSLNPLVIPNGIPATLLEPVDPELGKALRHMRVPDEKAIYLFKVGRFDLAKRSLDHIRAPQTIAVGAE